MLGSASGTDGGSENARGVVNASVNANASVNGMNEVEEWVHENMG